MLTLLNFFIPYRKYWWLVLGAMALSGLTAFFVTGRQPAYFEASTTLIIGHVISDPNPQSNEFILGQDLAGTYADIARRQPVREATMQALGLQNWLPEYSVSTRPEIQLVEITVQDTNPERAAAVANELGRQLVLQSPANTASNLQRADFVAAQLDFYEQEIDAIGADIIQAQDNLIIEDEAGAIQKLQDEVISLQKEMETLQSNYALLLASTEAGSINTITIVEEARRPERPVGPNVVGATILAIAMGFVFSTAGAYFLDRIEVSLRSAEEVERFTRLPTLASIYRAENKNGDDRLITIREPRSVVSEEYRKLRTGIEIAGIDRQGSAVLLITSANHQEGKSTTTANLGVVLAQAGKRVIVIDADLRRPSLHRVFKIHNRRGLTDLLLRFDENSGPEHLEDMLSQFGQDAPDVQGLVVLTCGYIPPNPSELASTGKLQSLIRRLGAEFDYILLDSPPLHLVTDAAVLSKHADFVLLVADTQQTSRELLKEIADQLRDLQANLIGVVLNRAEQQRGRSYYSYYRTFAGES